MDCKSVERENGYIQTVKEALGEDQAKILSSFREKGEKGKQNKISLKNSNQDHKKITITLSPSYRAEAENKNSLIKINNLGEKDSIHHSIGLSVTEINN